MKIKFAFIIILFFSFTNCKKQKDKNIVEERMIDDLITEINSPDGFYELWQSLPLKQTPVVDTTNIDNIKEVNKFNGEDIEVLQLSKIYPNIDKAGHNYKIQPAYKLILSDEFYTIILNVFKGDHELESILIIYDSDYKLSQYYNEEDKLTTNSLVIAYDEIAEGWSRKHAKIEQQFITVIDEFYGDKTQIDTTRFHLNRFGEINQISTKHTSKIRPNVEIFTNQIYTDTITFTAYNDDYDYVMLLGKKDDNDVRLIYDWDWQNNDKYNFKYGDMIEVTWKMDSIYIPGDGDTLDYCESVIDAERVVFKDKPVKFLWRAEKSDEETNQKFNSIVINESYVNTITNQEKAALGFVATFIGNECMWDGNFNEERSNLKCKILTALNLGYQCSDTHFGFLKRWFSKDNMALKKLEICVTIPESATVQSTFDEILIFTDKANKTIKVNYKAHRINIRESKLWRWTQADTFEYTSENITLINSEKSERVEETVNNNPDAQPQNSAANASKSFVISCGSGCAITYSEYKVITNDSATEVVFKVEMYSDEKLTEESFETYVFSCDNSEKASQITLKGDNDYNIKNQLPAIQENLRFYANQLCK